MEKIEIVIKPVVVYDEVENQYTIYDGNNKGGAIISDIDKDVAMEKFKEGMNLAMAVKALFEFKEDKVWNVYIPKYSPVE